jgi:hypothetical protein
LSMTIVAAHGRIIGGPLGTGTGNCSAKLKSAL